MKNLSIMKFLWMIYKKDLKIYKIVKKGRQNIKIWQMLKLSKQIYKINKKYIN